MVNEYVQDNYMGVAQSGAWRKRGLERVRRAQCSREAGSMEVV
jgi:hypothetical protein